MTELEATEKSSATGGKRLDARSLSACVHSVIRSYLRQKVKNRTGKDWEEFKAGGYKDPAYRDAINRVCMDAFYQIRSRKDRSGLFSFWAGTICSVPQRLNDVEPVNMELLDDDRWEDVQSLMLASLSAHSQPDVKINAE